MKVCELIEQFSRYKQAQRDWESLVNKCKSDNTPNRQELRIAYCNIFSLEETLDEWLPRFQKGIGCLNCKYSCKTTAGVCHNFEPKDED